MLSAHLDGLRSAMVAFVRYGDRAGLRAPVPTCPGWKVRHLVAHQGMVHRWTTGQVLDEYVDRVAIERIGMNADDPLDWLRDGALDLVKAMMRPSPVGDAATIGSAVGSAGGQTPGQGWARDQCHETTIHAADALAAALGRAPVAAEVDWITDEIALDGIDAMVSRVAARGQGEFADETPRRLLVWPDDADCGWLLEVGAHAPEVTRLHRSQRQPTDEEVLLSGSAVDVYLALWNRSSRRLPSGWDDWPEVSRSVWSPESEHSDQPAAR